MSCKSDGDQCVCDIVREIVEAQDEVAGAATNGCCTTSCEQSIEDLLSPVANGNGNGFTTIPFILYCDCEPFIASGVFQAPIGGSGNTAFRCVETPIFRAKKFVDEDECCVKLELLLPVTEGGSTPGGDRDEVCDFFPGNSIRDFQATGICITVDLSKFNAIACLDPVTPIPSSQFLNSTED
ncbi:CotY/CotZ family spore coat protein [Virgibacillus sp. DJP39]|uniref:CotY/CotZ family spore coat protein n=1 Tax=Virgibacillus sp. DJP39 TaxID=3409790 RepID=UPI003BB7EA2A